jgi:hypothetical protein
MKEIKDEIQKEKKKIEMELDNIKQQEELGKKLIKIKLLLKDVV